MDPAKEKPSSKYDIPIRNVAVICAFNLDWTLFSTTLGGVNSPLTSLLRSKVFHYIVCYLKLLFQYYTFTSDDL